MLVGFAAKLALAALSRTAVKIIWIDFIVFSSIVAMEPAGHIEWLDRPWITCVGLYDWAICLDELQVCNFRVQKVTWRKQREFYSINLLINNVNIFFLGRENKY